MDQKKKIDYPEVPRFVKKMELKIKKLDLASKSTSIDPLKNNDSRKLLNKYTLEGKDVNENNQAKSESSPPKLTKHETAKRPTGRPIVLATHLVPSLSVGLFEVIAEAIEEACNRPVVILYESRTESPVAEDIVDVAFLPTGEEWTDGKLLPISFIFKHPLNKDLLPNIFADVVVDKDRTPHVQTIVDLRGHKCALPDRKRAVGATTLLFNYLKTKGEGPSFFGSILDANSQLSALQMVMRKQVEACVIESPIVEYHMNQCLPEVNSLHILHSLGPLPPYKILVNNKMDDETELKIKNCLWFISNDKHWLKKLETYSCLGFAEYSKDNYNIEEIKPVATSAPYY